MEERDGRGGKNTPSRNKFMVTALIPSRRRIRQMNHEHVSDRSIPGHTAVVEIVGRTTTTFV